MADKASKEPFPRSVDLANKVNRAGVKEFGVSLYPGTGTKDGVLGDHVILAPAYNCTADEIEEIVIKTKETVARVCEQIKASS